MLALLLLVCYFCYWLVGSPIRGERIKSNTASAHHELWDGMKCGWFFARIVVPIVIVRCCVHVWMSVRFLVLVILSVLLSWRYCWVCNHISFSFIFDCWRATADIFALFILWLLFDIVLLLSRSLAPAKMVFGAYTSTCPTIFDTLVCWRWICFDLISRKVVFGAFWMEITVHSFAHLYPYTHTHTYISLSLCVFHQFRS